MTRSHSDLARAATTLSADRRGSIVPIVAVGATLLFGAAAVGVDASRAYSVQNELQTAADSAALAAVRNVRDANLARSSAQGIVQIYFPAATHGQVLRDQDVVLGTWNAEQRSFTPTANNPNALRVTLRRGGANGNPERLTFARMIGIETLDLEASATAMITASLPLCLLALNPTARNALEAAGSSKVLANDCLVHSNSSHDKEAIHVRPSASLTATVVCAVGNTKGSITPTAETGCDPLPDPLATLPSPVRWPANKCDDTNGSFGPGTITLNPGIYCGGIEVKSSTTVTLRPGVYQIVGGGGFKAGSGATVIGEGVHINVGGGGGSGVIDLRGSPQLELSAPTSGPYAGVVFHADRSQSGRTHYITGNANMTVDGTLYAPTGAVEFTGNSKAAITMLIANTVKFNGNSSFQRYAHLTAVPIPAGFSTIGGVSRAVLVD